MKKLLKILGAILIIIIIGILAYTYVGYNTWSPGNIEVPSEPSSLKYFQNSYPDCRTAFREYAYRLKEKFDSVEVFSVPVSCETDNDLTIDFCYIPARKEKSKLLILSSGTHGIEGFTGSAIQKMFMNELTDSLRFSETGVLLIHGMNPFGFKYFRRVTENNIDLNRNCNSDSLMYLSDNKGYTELFGMLNPDGEANPVNIKNRFFMLVAIQKLMQKSMKALRQAVLQGQYKYPEGLYFGGKRPESQISLLAPLIIKFSYDYEIVMNIDLHTGYGELGVLHLFPNPVHDAQVKSAMENVFAGYRINWGDSDDFYTISGAFSDYIRDLLAGKLYIPMTFEFGTLNSQTTIGSIHSIHNMILENQGFHYGYASDAGKEKVLRNFKEMYYPSSENWRSKVLNDSRKMIDTALSRFQKL